MMLSATMYRYIMTLRRSPADTISMFARVGVSAVLYLVFALFYLEGAQGAEYLCVSLALVNLITNAVAGAGFEGKEDGRDDRIDVVLLAPGGLRTFAWSQGMVQTAVAAVQSLLVMVMAALLLPGAGGPSSEGIVWLGVGLGALLVAAVAWATIAAWMAVCSDYFVQMNFATSVAVTLAGAYWPIEALPEPFAAVARMNPLTYALDLVRAPALQQAPLVDPVAESVIAMALAGLLVLLAVLVTRRRVDLSGRTKL